MLPLSDGVVCLYNYCFYIYIYRLYRQMWLQARMIQYLLMSTPRCKYHSCTTSSGSRPMQIPTSETFCLRTTGREILQGCLLFSFLGFLSKGFCYKLNWDSKPTPLRCVLTTFFFGRIYLSVWLTLGDLYSQQCFCLNFVFSAFFPNLWKSTGCPSSTLSFLFLCSWHLLSSF